MKRLKNLSDAERRFWSGIAIGSGITIFAFGSSLFPDTTWLYLRGWVTCIVGIILLIVGFGLAFIMKPQASTKGEETQQKIEVPRGGDVNQSMAEEKYEEYLLDERKSLFFAILEQAKSFDRWILTLAGGTFGLSLIFINQIAPNPQSGTIGLLVTGWAFFVLSILSTLVSFLLSQEACYRQIQDIHKLLKSEIDRSKELPLNLYGRITKGLNYFSMAAFLTGVAFLITFAALNLLSTKGA